MNLILLHDSDRLTGDRFTLSDHRAEHIRTVLQPQVGETVEIGLLNGPVGTAKVTGISSASVLLEISEWGQIPTLSYEIDIICAVPRPKTVKKVLAIAGSMNVRSIHFVRANRTDKSYLDSPLLQEPDALPYLYDGLSQGKFTRLPILSVHPLFRPFVEDEIPSLFGDLTKLLADPSGERLVDLVPKLSAHRQAVIAIGPEGGWVPFEIDLLTVARFVPFQLGPWTLRVENALVAALAQFELTFGNARL
jgi:RsmE family RNA methyltransferase